MVSELGSSVREGLASLPTREEMVQGVQVNPYLNFLSEIALPHFNIFILCIF